MPSLYILAGFSGPYPKKIAMMLIPWPEVPLFPAVSRQDSLSPFYGSLITICKVENNICRKNYPSGEFLLIFQGLSQDKS